MKTDIEPFKLHNNIYFAGSSKVSVHFIDTRDGLVFIDSGYPDMLEIITDAINVLGFSGRKICAILLTHGHIDHTGCAVKLKEMYGGKIYISGKDEPMLNKRKELSWANELGYEHLPDFNADVLLKDNDVLIFGNTKIRCVLTPGHTEGTMSFFIEEDGFVSAMHGGAGLKSMHKKYLEKYGLSLSCRDEFKKSITRLKCERVDLVLGNHPYQNDTVGKLLKVKKGEAAADKNEFISFLNNIEKNIDKMTEEGI